MRQWSQTDDKPQKSFVLEGWSTSLTTSCGPIKGLGLILKVGDKQKFYFHAERDCNLNGYQTIWPSIVATEWNSNRLLTSAIQINQRRQTQRQNQKIEELLKKGRKLRIKIGKKETPAKIFTAPLRHWIKPRQPKWSYMSTKNKDWQRKSRKHYI